MPKYHIIDDNDNQVGFVIIRSEQVQNFQNVASSGSGGFLGASGPVAESVLFLAVIGGSAGLILAVGGPGWLAVIVGVMGALSVMVIRAWRSGLPVEEKPKDGAVVRVEQVTSDGRHWVLREFDEALSLIDLQSTARAVVDADYQWARSVTTKAGGLSQTKHNKLQSDLLRLRYVEPLPNNANGYQVTRFGKRFFDAVLSLPSPP